ncbi:FkbM family methyltransferase [Azospirillum doebereinerae]|uniref:FkbM family methyltransferase n=1 Tax=Azospirillum doebereinerae TaxID=92933 RepID=UPI001EE60146|nr:FkbM family methyltransferase [Azospirillum doebereinerae]MCG5238893.1 FkbM family methyltransferase [Azospirillum doebereinerae]
MLSLFSTPKPFHGHIGLIQRNAVASWARLSPGVEAMLVGDDPGVADAARMFGLLHLGSVACSAWGTPLVSDIFAKAEDASRSALMAYVNADIVLSQAFTRSVESLAGLPQPWIAVGRRWDVDITEPLDFTNGWEERLRILARSRGRLHEATGIDYVVYPKGLYRGIMPPFAIGRVAWDNWILFFARTMGAMVIDMTDAVDCWHQNHDYAHIPLAPGETDPHATDEQNVGRMLSFVDRMAFTIDDATHVLLPDGGLVEARSLGRNPRDPGTVCLPHGALWLPMPGEVGTGVCDNTYEPGVTRFLARCLQPGMTVLDVGAHHGCHALAAARAVGPQGHVVAFEPSPRELLVLRMHRALNRLDNLEIEALAIGGHEATMMLHINRTLENGRNALTPPAGAARLRPWPVSVTTLDAWWQTHGHNPIDLIKIDVQGDEASVLAGARKLLRARKPVLIFDGAAPRASVAVGLEEEGFTLKNLQSDGSTTPFETNSNAPFLAISRGNLLAAQYCY